MGQFQELCGLLRKMQSMDWRYIKYFSITYNLHNFTLNQNDGHKIMLPIINIFRIYDEQ